MKALKLGCSFCALALAGGLLGFLVFAWLFCALIWGFPDNWKPLRGLPEEKTRALLALDAGQETFLVQMESGVLYTCIKQDCHLESTNWSASFPCTADNRPALMNFLPLLLLKHFDSLLACERSYTDIARIVVIGKAGGADWTGGGIGLIPTDAAVVITGLIGFAAGAAALLILALLVWIIRAIASRQKSRKTYHAQ